MYAGHVVDDDGGTEGGVPEREIDGAGKDDRRIAGEGTGEKKHVHDRDATIPHLREAARTNRGHGIRGDAHDQAG